MRNKQNLQSVRDWVINQLGKIDGTLKVLYLFEDNFRVNVWNEGRISESYFITVAHNGDYISKPAIEGKHEF